MKLVKLKGFSVLFFTILFIGSCGPDHELDTEISWDSWGVPHIYAPDEEQLFYAQGWSQMHLHGNQVLTLYGRARGRAAEYWGKEFETESRFIHTVGFPERAKNWSEKQDPQLKKLISAYVQGMNDYATQHVASIEEDKHVVLPIVFDDINLHYLNMIYAKFMAGGELGSLGNQRAVGSNAWAIGPSRSASKNAMLVQNPHLPWWGEYHWTEMHLMTDSFNSYGATLVGLPGLSIAFNENLGWSHTVNTIDVADIYELDLVEGGYLLDEKKTEFKKTIKQFRVKDSTGLVQEQKLEILHSEHGPILKKNKSKAFALRLSGLDASDGMLQWWRMAKAENFDQFEKALRMEQIPYFNVVYADKQGNIFYVSNGLIPKRSQQSWEYWNRIITGGKSEDIWTDVHPYSELPKVKNPPQGWLQNANDPAWSCTFPRILKRADFPGYMSPNGMAMRPQRSVHMLFEDESITYDELLSYKMSTRLELADRLLDDLFTAIDRFGSPTSKEAKIVLEKWDRQAEVTSQGTYLFNTWILKMFGYSDNMFATPWSDKDPRSTPDGLMDPKGAVKMLEEAADELKKEYGRLDVPWGDAARLKLDSIDLPANGANDYLGVFRVVWTGPDRKISGGDSWVGIIEFGDHIKANVLLSYGNATQAGSPHRGDQLKLFSEKKLRTAAFYRDDVQKVMVSKETLNMRKD
jgi:acyl-homoserine-lactone acylase